MFQVSSIRTCIRSDLPF